jgi:hypothetical protein
MSVEDIDLDSLYISLRDAQVPMDLDTAVREAARLLLQRDAGARVYAPGAEYQVGERLWFGDDAVDVVDVRQRGNPRQGHFAVLELEFPDGSVRRMAAAVRSASELAAPSSVSSQAVEELVRTEGPQIRRALLGDPRFAALIQSPAVEETRSGPCPSRLFSRHVLDEQIPEGPTWENLRPAFEVLIEGWERADADAGGEGLGTWEALVGPMLRHLGWFPVPLASEGGPMPTSFALFSDPADAEAATARLQQEKPV